MRRAFVTGCTGFLGATIAEHLLAHNIDVVGLRRPNSPTDASQNLPIHFVTGSLFDTDMLTTAMHDVDVVFHVAGAANYWQLPDKHLYHVNVEGTRSVMEAALRAGAGKVIYTSSTGALGIPEHNKQLMSEDNSFNLRPDQFPYGYSKHLAEQVVLEYGNRGLDTVRVLPSAIIGPRDSKFIAGELIVQVLQPTLPIIPIPSGGLNYIDVHDCAEAHISAAKKGISSSRYLLTGHNLTHKQTIDMIEQVLAVKRTHIDLPKTLTPAIAQVIGLLRFMGIQYPLDKSRILLSAYELFYDNARACKTLRLSVRPFTESVRSAYDWYIEFGYLKRQTISVGAAKTN